MIIFFNVILPGLEGKFFLPLKLAPGSTILMPTKKACLIITFARTWTASRGRKPLQEIELLSLNVLIRVLWISVAPMNGLM